MSTSKSRPSSLASSAPTGTPPLGRARTTGSSTARGRTRSARRRPASVRSVKGSETGTGFISTSGACVRAGAAPLVGARWAAGKVLRAYPRKACSQPRVGERSGSPSGRGGLAQYPHAQRIVAAHLPQQRVAQAPRPDETAGTVDRDRTHVEGVHVQPDAMQSEPFEGVFQNQFGGLAPQAATSELQGRERNAVPS